MSKAKNLIHKWHEVIESDDLKMLNEIIADNAVFSSPVVFKPMEGKEITMMYLHAAGQSFNMEKFKYTKEIHDDMNSVWDFWVSKSSPPVRACVESKLASPKYLVEIQITAAV